MAVPHQHHKPLDIDRMISVLSYLTLVGWVIALLLYGKHHSSLARFHLRQSLGLIVTAAVLSIIPLFGWVLFIPLAFAWLAALYSALLYYKLTLPIVGDFFQEHLDFIS